MNILVTGASGFIGRNLTSRLQELGHIVFCTLRPDEENLGKLEGYVLDEFKLVEGVAFFKKNKIEGVIHLASFVQSGEHNLDNLNTLIDTNVKFSTLILELAVLAKVKWFINTGTFWQNFNDEEYSPVNLYAATKQAFESIAKYYAVTQQILFYTIKLFDTYGHNDTRPKIFNLWAKIASSGETLAMSPGEQLIDICFIDDIISAYIHLIDAIYGEDSDLMNFDTFSVIGQKRLTLKELATIFEQVVNCSLNINWGGRTYKPREIMIPYTKYKTVPNWIPKTSIEEGIRKIFVNSN